MGIVNSTEIANEHTYLGGAVPLLGGGGWHCPGAGSTAGAFWHLHNF